MTWPKPKDVLDQLHHRPGMFTGENTLSAIRHFLGGYSFALELRNIPSDEDPLVLPGDFHQWVAYRLRYRESTSGWYAMISGRTESEQDAIDTFFRLLVEFRTRKPHTVARLTGFQKTYLQSVGLRGEDGTSQQGPFITREYPSSISLVTYTEDPGFFAYSETRELFPCEGFHPDLETFELRSGADRSLLTIIDHEWNPQSSKLQDDQGT